MAQQEQQGQNIEQYREKVTEKIKEVDKPQELLKQSLDELTKVGGFDLLENAIDGVQNLNPERKARKKIFLTESHNAEARKDLSDKIDLWMSVLQMSDDVSEIISNCEAKAEESEKVLKTNLKSALGSTKDLE